MAVYTFSTQDKKRPTDKDAVDAVKDHCDRRGLNFSALVVDLLRTYKKDNIDEQRRP